MALTAPAPKTSPAQIATRCLLIPIVFLGLGCTAKAMDTDIHNPVGVAEMSNSGVLTIRMFNAPKGGDTQSVKPADPYYEQTRQMVGGISPGERKPIFESIGQIQMDDHGVIAYNLRGIEKSGPQFLKSGTSKPGDADYESWVARVGGLKPGETKPIPAQ